MPFNRQAQHDAKRIAILSQAARLFNGKGSRATTLQDIAASLGLTKTSLYYYVKTKEELIYQCYMAALDRQHQSLDAIERAHTQPFDRLSAFLIQQFHNWSAAVSGHESHQAALLEIASLKSPHRQTVEGRYVALFKRLRGFVHEGMSDGSLRQCDATSTTRAILGSVDWVFHWLHDVPADQVGVIAQQAIEIIGHGLYAGDHDYTHVHGIAPIDADLPVPGFNRDEQNRLKQEAFYKAGTWFFNRKGFNGASLDEIADYLNVSKGAFYYHIRNKEDLLYQCYNYSLDILAHVYDRAEAGDGSGMQKIEQTSRQIFYIQNSNLGPLIRYNTITALPKERRKRILARTDAINDRFVEFIHLGMEDGSIRRINPMVARNLLAGAINASMEITLWRRVDDVDRAALDYFDVFYNGILNRTDSRMEIRQ
ncbi:TetR family transcriptional regulator [Chromatocurvus halotolerans]|uniref:TetR family transcriptional regulator n=2 Tax=Chromatocurvus halotolerans TaxID=1132028 RepID=A0A4R2KC26_9GAMM|nr:TetR family transcriptional regulator [Chromatocurvus halotolerans]